jgi:sigma-B regulation protein RsbU (phosphoserine phosphatase)
LMNSQNGLFVTAVYGLLSLSDGVLTYTMAGHNPPMVLRSDHKEVVELEKGGIALGAMPEIHLEERSLKLEPGDCLVLYTDGVTEAFNSADQMYGDARLKKVLESAIGKSAHEVLAMMEADLDKFRQDAPLSDDTTILAICREDSLANQDGNRGPAQDTIDGAAK